MSSILTPRSGVTKMDMSGHVYHLLSYHALVGTSVSLLLSCSKHPRHLSGIPYSQTYNTAIQYNHDFISSGHSTSYGLDGDVSWVLFNYYSEGRLVRTMRRTRREGAFAIGLSPAIISRAGAARRVERGLQFLGLPLKSSLQ